MRSHAGGTDGGAAAAEVDECVVCMEGRKEWVLFPCLHEVLCGECAKPFRLCDLEKDLPFKACPVCRCALMYPFVLKGGSCGDLKETLNQRNVFRV